MTDLLLVIFRWAGSNRYSQVKAEVMRNNARALRFFEKFGFTVPADEAIPIGSSIILTITGQQASDSNDGQLR